MTVRPRRAEPDPHAPPAKAAPASVTRRPSQHARILAAPPGVREIPHMVATVARRTLAGLAVVVGAVTLTFFLVRLAPGGPLERLAGPPATAAPPAAPRPALRPDRPLPAH